jgi:hypothetical protein
MITPSFALTATERVLPRLALDFTTASLDPRITFTRTGNTATVINSSGLIEMINADLPRFDYTLNVGGACKGLLIEEARTNNVINSALSGGTSGTPGTAPTNWTQSVVGASTATYALDNEINFTGYTYKVDAAASQRLYLNQIVSVSANTSYFVSVTIDIASGSEPINSYFILVSTPAGATTAYFLNGASVASSIVPSVGRHTIGILLTVAATSGVASVRMGAGTFGGVASTTNVTFRRPQFEAGAFATSYIPTAGSGVARNADIPNMTGTNFSDWYNATEGTFAFTGTPSEAPATDAAARFAFVALDTIALNSYLRVDRITGAGRALVRAGGSTNVSFPNASWPLNANARMVLAYKDASNRYAYDGSASIALSGDAPTGLVQLSIGQIGNGTSNWCGHIRTLRYWPQRLTNSEVQAFSK